MTLALVDLLARLQLAAKRRGTPFRVVHAAPGLRELVALAGLEEALGVEPRREPEEREERLRVEEEGELDDTPV